ncbi:MAG: PQQ-dependent sugar dehydrogenase [Bacteroidota bacterium]
MPTRLLPLLAVLLAAPAFAQGLPELLATPPASASLQANLPPGFYLEDAAAGARFDTPVALAAAPDGRIFVAEKRGRVYVIQNGQRITTPFLNIESEVLNHHDRGLLGLTLDPDFESNGYVYVLYTVDHLETADRGRKDAYGRLTRYTVRTSNPNRADETSRRVLIGETFREGIPACYFSHAPGTLDFGSDGTLFVGTGDAAHYGRMDDGGEYDECFGSGKLPEIEDVGSYRSLYLASLAGKILRVDPATGLGLPSNPFYTGDPSDNESRVWASGLRNPYRFAALGDGSTDPADGNPGRLIYGDVGWKTYEELGVVSGGESFGWPCFEGPLANNEYQNGNPPHSGCGEFPQASQTFPSTYWHRNNATRSNPPTRAGRTIVGGDLYQGTRYPVAYQGQFFYADYSQGWMAYGRPGDTDDSFTEAGLFSANTGTIVDVEYDPATEHLLLVDVWNGRIQRLRHTAGDANNPPVPVATSDVTQGMTPLTVQFGSSDSFDPDGDAFSRAWDFGDGTTSTAANPSHTFTQEGVYTVTLALTDVYNVTATTTLTITAGGTAPTAAIAAPLDGDWARVGETVPLIANASDPDEPAANLFYQWEITQVHDDHQHFDVFTSSEPETSFVLPEHGADGEIVYYVVQLTVMDGAGLTDTVEQNLYVQPEGSPLPAPWSSRDIGPVAVTGSTSASGGRFTVEGAGDVWGNAGAFHFAHRDFGGDGAITARLSDLTGAHPWAKVGLMIRENLTRGSAHAMIIATPESGVHLQYRPAQGASMVNAASRSGAAPVWLRLQRDGDTVTALTSDDGVTWIPLGTIALPMQIGVHVGMVASATDYEGRNDTASGVFSDVSVGPVGAPPPPEDLPAPWASRDIGPVAVVGSATHMNGTFSLSGAGDVWGSADRFHFLHQPLTGDGTLTARLAGLSGVHPWAKIGLMMREDLSRGSAHAMLIVTPENGAHLQYRTEAGESTASTPGPSLAAPTWLRLVRQGDTITAFVSPDGAVWSISGTATIPMSAAIRVGLMATSTDFEGRDDTASGTFDSVSLTEEVEGSGLPAPWLSADIGPVAVAGGTVVDDGVFTVTGAGDLWGNADALHFAYQPLDGDATIMAHLTDVQGLHPWAKVGLMMREDLSRESAYAMLLATPDRGLRIQYRGAAGNSTTSLPVPDGYDAAPMWLQFQRSGDVIAAALSRDGVTWESAGSIELPLAPTLLVGLAATSTDYEGRGDTASGRFETVMVDGQAGAAARPLPSPANLETRPFAIETVYPNPFRGQTTTRVSLEEPGRYRVDVVDMLGREVVRREIREEAAGVFEIPLDLRGQSAGTYVVRVLDLERGRATIRRVLLVR